MLISNMPCTVIIHIYIICIIANFIIILLYNMNIIIFILILMWILICNLYTNVCEIFHVAIYIVIHTYIYTHTHNTTCNYTHFTSWTVLSLVYQVHSIKKQYFRLCCASLLSCVWLPWAVAHQAPVSMGIPQARKLEWAAMPSSRGSSQPRDQTQVSPIASRFFTNWTTREPQEHWSR